MIDDRDALYPPGSLTGARRPGLTGSSHDDLPKMAAWVRDNPAVGHVDRARAFSHDPGPVNGAAEVGSVPREDIGRLVDRRSLVDDAMRSCLSGLELLLGPGVGASVRAVVNAYIGAEQAVATWQMRRGDQAEGTIAHLREILDSRDREIDRARDLAARLEEEVARLTDPWIGRYLQALEDAVGEDRLGEVQQAASEAWRAAGSPMSTVEPVAVAMPDPGLPIVDDASLPEHAIQFLRADGSAIAVGVLERVFGPLDQAAQIAVGAVPTDLPGEDAAHPLDDLDDAIAHGADLVTWPDGTQFRLDPDGSWQLIATSQNEGRWAHVATPTADRSAGSRRVDIGSSWGPYGDPTEAPRPAPPGPADPPRPPHHRPYA